MAKFVRKIILIFQPRGLAMRMPALSLIQGQKRFGTEQACAKALVKVRWPNGFQCPSYYMTVKKRDFCHEYRCRNPHCLHGISRRWGSKRGELFRQIKSKLYHVRGFFFQIEFFYPAIERYAVYSK